MRLEPEAVRAQAARISASRVFAGSERLRRFLQFTVDAVLEGRGAGLKEYAIGVDVFDRGANYDPRLEPIVRVEARRLRAKLRAYYEEEGRDDPIRIEYPKGGYAPEFRECGAPESAAAAKSPFHTIAALPFLNLGSDPDQEYFSDGLTHEVIHALTRLRELRVVAAPSLRGPDRDLGDIARRLNVELVLNGTIRHSGDRLRVTVQLVEASTGFYLWSETYDRLTEDVFAIQEDIARSVAQALRLQLTANAVQAGRPRPSLSAYHLYLRGRYLWSKRTAAGLQRSVECFQEAIRLEPDYAEGHAGLADAYAVLAEYGLYPQTELMGHAEKAARRALALDPTLAEAHTSLALIESAQHWRWEEARKHFERAIELNPGYPTAHHWFAYTYLAPTARLDEAWEEVSLAQRLEPLSPGITVACATLRSFQRRFSEAAEYLKSALDLDPSGFRARLYLGRTYGEMGRHDEGIAIMEPMAEDPTNGHIALSLLGHAYAAAGYHGKAREVLRRLEEHARHIYVSSFLVARVYLGFPDLDAAFPLFHRALDERDSRLMHLRVAPVFDCLRADARYAELLRRLGL